MSTAKTAPAAPGWRSSLYRVIFESDTPGGRAFDVALLCTIVVSVIVVALESVDTIEAEIGGWLSALEWLVTGLFTVEYVLRLVCLRRPVAYALSFYGLVDLMSILPSYLGVLWPGMRSLLVIRVLRLLRMFRILKLVRVTREAQVLLTALRASRSKITVFLVAVTTLIVISGTLMYLVESGAGSGFTSIPRAMYWAVVTMTTVGYGDIAPKTPLGQFLAAVLMIAGYAIIAVPTGIVSAELVLAPRPGQARRCPHCSAEGHADDAVYCMRCGGELKA